MRAVFGRGVEVVVETVGLYLDVRHGLRRELGGEGLLHFGLAESAGTGASHADAHVARAEIGDEHAYQGKTGSRVPKLHVGAALRDLERHCGDELGGLERRFVESLEE